MEGREATTNSSSPDSNTCGSALSTSVNRLRISRIARSFEHSQRIYFKHMDSSLHEVWQAAAGSPFLPSVAKSNQFIVGFVLLLAGLTITGVFALNRSLVTVPLLGIPASLALAYGVVYMFCAVGVYV